MNSKNYPRVKKDVAMNLNKMHLIKDLANIKARKIDFNHYVVKINFSY